MASAIDSDLGPQLLKLLNAIERLPDVTIKNALTMVGEDAKVLVQKRVQIDGESTNSKMVTNSSKRIGVYSKGHYLAKQKKNLLTSHVDLTFNGDLWLSWQTLNVTNEMVEIGFNKSNQGDKADYLEAYYGLIFELNKEEEEIIFETFESEIKNSFTNLS